MLRRLRGGLHHDLCLSFHLDLNFCPDLNLNFNLNLIPRSYQSLLQQLFAASLGSMFTALAFDF